MTNLYLHQK